MRAWPPAWAHLQPNCKFIASYMEIIKSVYPTICYIAAVCMVAAVTACTSSPGGETEPELNEYPIAFQSPQMESRGAVDDAQDMSDFRVWGWRTPENESPVPVFEGEKVSAGSWTYEGGTRYWMMDQTYNFYAVHPVFPLEGNETTVNVTSDGTFTINNFDCSKTGDEAVDLMTASAEGIIYKTGETPQKVGLEFKHLLAKVDIVGQSEGSDAYITQIQLTGIASAGNYLLSKWELDENQTTTYTKESFSLPAVPTNIFGSLLLIPQSVNEIQLSITYEFPGIANSSQTQTLRLPATPDKWESGNHYQYSFTLEGNYIIFNPPQVNEWKEASGGIIIIA